MKLYQFVSLVSNLIIWKIVSSGNECRTPQYIEIGSVGVIQCSFRDDISGALWYKLTTNLRGDAFLTLVNSVKSGEGFLSGEFDIYPNGSLIIQNVSLKHEGTYQVTILETAARNPNTHFVNVFVFAPTFSGVPVIDNCDNKSEICFQILNSNSNISCTIRDARSEIPLRWMLRTSDGDRNISARLLIKNETYPFFTSRVTTTNAFFYSRALTLLVCEAYCPLGLLEKNKSLVLIQGSDETLPNVLPKVVYAKQDTRVQLNCSAMANSYLVWEIKEPSSVIFKRLIHAVFVGDNLNHLYDEEYELQNTSIVVENVRVHHEGTYRCISGNGFQDDVIMYELIVFVYPDPPYPVVNGCSHQQYCVLEGHPEKSLTCTIKGIRPQVDLALMEVFGSSSNALQFYDSKITITYHGVTSDVLLTSKYRCNSVIKSHLTVECRVVGTNIEELLLSTKFDLQFSNDAESTTVENVSSGDHSYWVIAVVLTVVTVFVVLTGLLIAKVCCRRVRKRTLYYTEHRMINHEVIPMMSRDDSQGKKDRPMFISELKFNYQDLYDAVQPIPYIRDRLYCVDRVIVDGGIDEIAAEKIKQRLRENPILGDLCQVPLFFVMFAHMSHESEQFQKFNSVTSFFRYMISCFHSHMKNKMEDENVKKYDLFEAEHTELDKLAFEGLSRKDQQIVWNKHYMCERLGQDFYDQYLGIGILVEEEVLDIDDDPNATISEHIQYKTKVRFYHKLFCEWYAAHHLSEYASRDDVTFDPWEESEGSERSFLEEDAMNNDNDYESENRNNTKCQTDSNLKYLDPFDRQYVYRFSCGLNRTAADKIIEYLKTRGNATEFAILCTLEKSGKVEDVPQHVVDLCSELVQIKDVDTLLPQRSTIQLLEIAAANTISISCVSLHNCYSTVDLPGGNHLQLKSNLSMPVLTTLNQLWIEEEGREITSEEFLGILQYSSKCLNLKQLVFSLCLLPPSVQAESVSVLRSRNVKVSWNPQGVAHYQLNLQSCLWEVREFRKRSRKTRRHDDSSSS